MRRISLLTAVLLLTLSRPAMATNIGNVTSLGGARTNTLNGWGLVIGLKGTGDGGNYLPAMKPLAQLLTKFADPTSTADLSNASNVAIVLVTATIPADGARNGQPLDVHVMSVGAATSLKSGYLYAAPLLSPTIQMYKPLDAQGNPAKDLHGNALPEIPFAVANGNVTLEDPSSPNNGIVKGGAKMEVDLPTKCVDDIGRFTLIIGDPWTSATMADSIAKLINESNDGNELIAVAVDQKNVVVQIPKAERGARQEAFIANVQRLPLPNLPEEARVRMNSKTGTMVVTGDVEISPALINYKTMSITTTSPTPAPTVRNPKITTTGVVALDTTNRGGTKLADLASAFDQLKVPAEDRIAIMKELYETGRLKGKLNIDGEDK